MVICIDTLVFSKDVSNELEKNITQEGFKKIFDDGLYSLFIKDEAFPDRSKIALEYIKKSYRHSINGESKLNILALSNDHSKLEEYISTENDSWGSKKKYIKGLIDIFSSYEEAKYKKVPL